VNIPINVSSKALVAAVVMARKALSLGVTKSLYSAAQKTYQDIAALLASQCTDSQSLFSTHKYLPHASSVSLSAINNRALVQTLLSEIARGSGGSHIRKMLGSNEVICDFDQAWIRRQYAPHLYPAKHAPHGWHQDGALGFNFLSTSSDKQDAETLLPTVTCWIALTPCGVDAPGLEFVSKSVEQLLLPNELTHNIISSRFGENSFYKPQMDAGDAVIFQGGTLHRTHVVNAMQANRTSVELRFVGKHNIPQRLSGDYFIPLPHEVE
jgi:ectoine hydroxylase-related dioxygenase (phytanoyl-CoA dioxygenase family)